MIISHAFFIIEFPPYINIIVNNIFTSQPKFMNDEMIIMKWIVKTRHTYRETYSETEKILYLDAICHITFCEEFPQLIGKDILCKQFFLFPERYKKFDIWHPVQIHLPARRIEEFIKDEKAYLNVTIIEIDVYEMMKI